MELKGKKVLVTGADGFIGSHLTEALVRMGCQVRAFVLYNSFNSWGWLDHSPKEIIDQVEVFAGDIRDPHGIREAMKGCDIVFHLAALIAIPYSYHSPDTYIDTNVKGTLNVIQAAKELGISKVVHTSTSEVYGTAQYVPMDESHPLKGQSPYSASKIGADQIALSFYYSFQTPVAVIRPFNTYGPRQSARAIIPTVITQIAGGSSTIRVGSITPTRDFNFIKDTVAGFIAVGESPNSIGEVINIGSGYEISIEEVIHTVANAMNREIQIEIDPQRVRPEASEVDRLWADASKAHKLLGWKPQFAGKSGFARGIKETVEWFSDPQVLKAYKANMYNI